MGDLCYKGYSRIFVQDKSKIQEVEDILKSIDESEFTGYYPTGLVTEYIPGEYLHLIYSGKFDLNIKNFCKLCWNKGIPVWVHTQSFE